MLLFLCALFAQNTSDKKTQDILKKWAGVDIQKLQESPLNLACGFMEIKEHEGDIKDMKVWIATQGVRLWQGDKENPLLDIICDQAVVWFKPLSSEKDEQKNVRFAGQQKLEKAIVYAEGNVHFRWAKNYFQGSQVLFDLIENKGTILKASLRSSTKIEDRTIPLYLRAENLLIQSEKKFIAKDASISTCQFGIPHYHFSAKEIQVTQMEKKVFVQARENTLEGLGVPIFYIPYVAGESIEHWPLKKIQYGSSSKWRHYLLTTWGGNLYEGSQEEKEAGLKNLNWLLDLDARQERGFAVGPHLKYEGNAPSQSPFVGEIYGYYVHDQPLSDLGKSMSYQPDDSEKATWDRRYRLHTLHRHKLEKDWTLDMEIYKISDRNLLLDFFDKEAREEREPESYVYARKLGQHQAFTFLASSRLNDFQSQIEYLPQGVFHVIFQPLLPESIPGLYWSSRVEISEVRRKDDEDFPTDFQGEHVFRSDWHNLLSYSFSLGPLHFLPFAGARLSYYEKGVDEDKNLFRSTGEVGIDLATHFYRSFSWKSDLLQISDVLHVFTPEFRYQWIYASSVEADDLIPFDSLDSIERMQMIQLVLNNRLRTMRDGKVVDFFLFDTTFTYYPERDLAKKGIFLTDQGWDVSNRWEKFDNLRIDLRWAIRSNLYMRSKAEYNFQLREMEIMNASLSYKISQKFTAGIDQRYHRNNSNITTASLAYIHDEKWACRISAQYDFQEKEMREMKFVVRRVFHRFALDFTVKIDEVDDDNSVQVNFYPLDFVSKDFVDPL